MWQTFPFNCNEDLRKSTLKSHSNIKFLYKTNTSCKRDSRSRLHYVMNLWYLWVYRYVCSKCLNIWLSISLIIDLGEEFKLSLIYIHHHIYFEICKIKVTRYNSEKSYIGFNLSVFSNTWDTIFSFLRTAEQKLRLIRYIL